MEERDGGGGRNRCSQGQSRKWRRNGQSGLFTAVLFFLQKKGAKLFLRVFDREKSRKKEAFCSFLRFNYAMRIPPKSRCKCFPDSLLPMLQHGFRCNIFPLPLPPLASVAASQASAKSRVNIGGRPFLLRGGKKARMKAECDTRKIPRKARFQRLGRIRRELLMEAPSVKR